MSPNGQVTLVTMKGQLTAFETPTGKPLWTRKWNGVLPGFSLDDRSVAVVTERKMLDFKIEIIDLLKGSVGKTFAVKSDKPSLAQLQFTQNGWLTCFGDNELIILNATSGVKIRALHFMGDEVRRLSPSGAVVATNNANRIRLWDTKSGRLLRSLNGLIPLPWKFKFSPDGAMLLSARGAGDGDGIVDFWLTRLEEEVVEIATGDVLNSASRFLECRVAFDLDGSRVYKLRNTVVESWLVGANRKEWIARSNGELFSDLAVHPNDGTVMVSENAKSTFTHLSDVGAELPPFGTSKSSSVQFNRGGEFLLTVKVAFAKVRPGKGAIIFDYATGDELWSNDDVDRPFAVFCLSDRAVATAALAGGIDVWDWKLNERLFQIDASQTGSISCLAASPDGRLLATGGLDRWIRVWDLSTGTLKTAFRAHWEGVRCLKFSLDASELLSGDASGTVRIHDATQGDERLAFYGLSTSVADVDFSPNGTHLAAIGRDGLVKIWDRHVSLLASKIPRQSAEATLSAETESIPNPSIQSGDPPDAIAAFQKAIELDPTNVVAAEMIADALMRNLDSTLTIAPAWRVIEPAKMTMRADAELIPREDGSVLNVPAVGTNDRIITLMIKPGFDEIAAIRLETMTDASLPQNGPGRHSSGNFHLVEVRCFIRGEGDSDSESIKIKNVSASYGWLGKGPENLIDDDLTTDWHVWSNVGTSHHVILTLENSLTLAPTQSLEVCLYQQPGFELGRFRLSASSASEHAKRMSIQRLSSNPWLRLAAAYHWSGDDVSANKVLTNHPDIAEEFIEIKSASHEQEGSSE